LTPDAFGPFRVLHQIGAGTLGPVFRAHDPARDRIVAVKQFTLDLPPERRHQLVALFEQLIAADLSHHAIATPFATGLMDGFVYLAQEAVSAESLDHVVREYGPAPAADAIRVATELAGAFDFAAVVHIHHGALHPRDVLLSTETTKVTGIGVARALEHVGVATPVRRPYAAPERIAGGTWDRRADIFSLAALVHELLWGRRLRQSGAETAASLTALPDVDMTALRSAFARALAEDPGMRFDTALEFAEALKEAFAVRTVPASDSRGSTIAEPRLPLDDAEPERAPLVTVSDLDRRQAEVERYADAAVGPAIVTDEPATTEDAENTEAVRYSPDRDVPSVSPLVASVEKPPSRIGPLFVMLAFGVMVGLAAGYVMWSRPDPVAPARQTASVPEPLKPAAPSGREFTEGTVAEPPKAPDNRAASPPPERTPATPPAKPDAADATNPATEPGRLLVRSTPSGATVIVDGREHGETPIAIRDLARGTHRVRVVRDGYAPVERQIVITPSRPAQSIVVPMYEARATASHGTLSSNPTPSTPATIGRYTGAVVIESKPSGAKVYLDNKLAGTTPLTLPQVPAGSHAIRLERDGYRRWSAAVRVVATERSRITASLER
jgi:serine/threonine protein kinase